MRTAIIGGGAAGFFLAVNLKELAPQMEVTIFERGQRVLRKVAVSGGGRCNCTNTFHAIGDLSQAYPRGHRLLKRLLHGFDQRDAYEWFERHGVPLTVLADGCVFPRAQDSKAVVDCFLSLCRSHGVNIVTGRTIASLAELSGYDFIAVTTGGVARPGPAGGLALLAGHEVVEPVPSLFSLSLGGERLHALQGLVAEQATVYIPGTKFRADGALLITHWGVSGPAVLRLSSYAARHLADCGYRAQMGISWLTADADTVLALLRETAARQPQKLLTSSNPCGLQQRLWAFLAGEALDGREGMRWGELGRKGQNRLVNVLTNHVCSIEGRAPFNDEFVTCGGVALSAVSPNSLESRSVPRLYFAGEVLDIDGITGGFNLQAAWTTAYTVARSIAQRMA